MKFDELVSKTVNEFPDAHKGESNAQTRVHDLEMILNIVRKINTSLELDEVLELVTDESIRIAKADRGFLMLAGADGELQCVVARNARGENIQAEHFQLSSTVLHDVFTTGESLCIENALTDERFERRESIMNLSLQTIVCSPLRTQDENLGVLYLDSKRIQSVDKTEILWLFEILVGQAALAIRNARLYANLRNAYEKLEEAHQHIIQSERMAMKGELASEISHELKNLVGVVLLSLQRLQTKINAVSSEEINTIIEKAIGGVRKIEGFSKSLLTKPHANVRFISHDVEKVITDFTEFMKFLPKFKANRITISVPEGLPAVNIDIDQIQQVLLNLVNNIVEARPDAAMHFAIQTADDHKSIQLKLHDDGPGIAELVRQKIFKERVTTKVDGYGYGLLVCRQIMHVHGGSIRVESTEGAGTTFVLTFPSSSAMQT